MPHVKRVQMDRHEITVVIPAFKDYEQLKKCLLSLYNGGYTGFNLIVVDHGETDVITQWVMREYPQVECLRGTPSLWWTGAINIGIRHALDARSKLIIPLNHDCYFRKDTFTALLSSYSRVSNSIVAPVQHNLLDKKELICATSCFLLGFLTVILPEYWCRKKRSGNLRRTRLIIGGRGALISADIFQSVGLFDEAAFPHYLADHDFYLRCRKQKIGLYTCVNAIVDIDDNARSKAGFENIPQRGFIGSLIERGSHRNLMDTNRLFSKYYPIPGFSFLGMSLYLIRYTLVYFYRFIFRKLSIFRTPCK